MIVDSLHLEKIDGCKKVYQPWITVIPGIERGLIADAATHRTRGARAGSSNQACSENRWPLSASTGRSTSAVRSNSRRKIPVIRLENIQLENPLQNAYIERYNRTVRYGWLGRFCLRPSPKCKRTVLVGSGHRITNAKIWLCPASSPKQKLAFVARSLLLASAINGGLPLLYHRSDPTTSKGTWLILVASRLNAVRATERLFLLLQDFDRVSN